MSRTPHCYQYIRCVYTHVQRTFIIKILLFFLDDNSWMHQGDFECDKVLVGGNGVDVVDVVAAHMAM